MSQPLLSPTEVFHLEQLFGAAQKSGVDEVVLKKARVVLDDLRSGRSLERVLVPMLSDIDKEMTDIEGVTGDLKPGVARETARGRVTGLRFAKHRIARDNVVTMGKLDDVVS